MLIMDNIKTEPTFLTIHPSESFLRFPHDEALNHKLPNFIKIKKEASNFDDEFYNLINPSESAIHETDNIMDIKTEQACVLSLPNNNTGLSTEKLSSTISEAKFSVELNLEQQSTSIIKHESICIKVESHGESDATPWISDLESSLISIKDESYGKFENFENFTVNECLTQSDNNFCNICGKNFVCIGSLNRHCTQVHEKSKNYLCRICNKIFFRKEHLKNHEKIIHLKIRDWKCSFCDKCFSEKAKLKIHEKTVHLKIREFKCNLCDKYFSKKFNLKVHEETVHLKILRWKCNICEKSFARKADLKSHAKVHLSDYSEECDICNKSVRHLQAHKYRMHSKTRAKNLKCTHCDKVFLQKRNLKQHMMIHSDVRD